MILKGAARLLEISLIAAAFLSAAATAAAEAPLPVVAEDFLLPPQDPDGWSVLAPSEDSRLVYADSVEGCDEGARVYSPGSPEIGGDPAMPAGQIFPFRTIAAAKAHLRPGHPDWLLLRAGRHWEESLNLNGARGRSREERMVATAYGRGGRPELRTGAGSPGWADRTPAFVAVVGIRFWAHTRDETGPFWSGAEAADRGAPGLQIFTEHPSRGRPVRDVLIEDCVFRAYGSNEITSGHEGGGPVERLAIRRCQFLRNWQGARHGQGLWFAGHASRDAPSLLLEGCLFDHNGWRTKNFTGNAMETVAGQAQMLSHHTYMTGVKRALLQGNLFLRACSIGSKFTSNPDSPRGLLEGVVVRDNLYVEGEVALSAGGNYAGPGRHRDIHVLDNVFTDIGRDPPTRRSLSFYLEVRDWEGGRVAGNCFLNQTLERENVWALVAVHSPGGGTRGTVIENNTFSNLRGSRLPGQGLLRFEDDGGKMRDILFRNNRVEAADDTTLASLPGDPGGFRFEGNRYAGPRPDAFGIADQSVEFAAWALATGETGTWEESSPAAPPGLEDYFRTLGLENPGWGEILALLESQGKGNWRGELTAPAINKWIRDAINLRPPPSAPKNSK